MKLSEALQLGGREVVTFTGAGGKTTAIARLARELAAAGGRVVLAPTARVGREQLPVAYVADGTDEDLRAAVRAGLQSAPIVAVTGVLTAEGTKWEGVRVEQVEIIAAMPEVDYVLVEADGARQRPFKAPLEHEPVTPACTTILVPTVGARAFGQPVAEPYVHRPEQIALFKRWGPLDERVVTPELVASVLGHPAGGLKHSPAGARVVGLINQCEAERIEVARQCAQALLQARNMDSVLLATVGAEETAPVVERLVRVSAIVLAAGASRRLGQPKQLVPWGPLGVPLLAYVVDQVRAAVELTEVYVVVGSEAERVGQAVPERGLPLIWNQEWESGQSSSVRASLNVLPTDIGAVLFVPCDMPGVTPQLLAALIHLHRTTGAWVCVPRTAGGQRGAPTLWDRATFADLRALEGDTGGRALIAGYAARERVAWLTWGDEILQDIDRPEDLPG